MKTTPMKAFENWIQSQALSINPEGLQFALDNRALLTDVESEGLNQWMEAFRELFGVA